MSSTFFVDIIIMPPPNAKGYGLARSIFDIGIALSITIFSARPGSINVKV
jgi:hypothetical protein